MSVTSSPGSFYIECQVKIQPGTILCFKNGTTVKVLNLVGQGSSKDMYAGQNRENAPLALTCAPDSSVDAVRAMNQKLSQLKQLTPSSYVLLPSLFQQATLTHLKISRRVFCQTSTLFREDLTHFNARTLTLISKQQQALPAEQGLTLTLISNIEAVNQCLFGPTGVIAWISAHHLAHNDLYPDNIVVNTTEEGEIREIKVIDWDDATLEDDLESDIASAKLTLANMPLHKSCSSFKQTLKLIHPLQSVPSIFKLIALGCREIHQHSLPRKSSLKRQNAIQSPPQPSLKRASSL